MIKHTFLTMKWKELANSQGANYSIDWSWLEKPKTTMEFDHLWISEWHLGFEQFLRNQLKFDDDDIYRTRWRMVMGAMRYGSRAGGNFLKLSREYYLGRLADAGLVALTNREGLYDFVNIMNLAFDTDVLRADDYYQALVLAGELSKVEVEYNGTDRTD